MGDLDWDAAPFDFPPEANLGSPDGKRRGVLLVHGFTGTPFEVSYLGRSLAAQGFHAVGPVLAGHARDPDALNATTWRDWYGVAEAAFDELRARCDVVAVCGLSMGGLCTLHLARHRGREIAAIVPMAVPLWMPDYVGVAVPHMERTAKRLAPLVAGMPKGPSDVRDPEARRRNPALKYFPLTAVRSFLEFCEVVRSEIELVTTPVLIAHGKQDHTAAYACAVELRARIGSPDARLLTLPDTFHLAPIDVERRRLAREVGQFLKERM